MGFLERSAIRRAERQLAGAMELGEAILQFDIGTNPRGSRIDCIATNRALYMVPKGGAALRIPYTTIRQTGGGPTWLSFVTLSGSEYHVDFGRTARGVSDVVVDHYRRVAEKRRRFHVDWGNGGVSFLVGPHRGDGILSWSYDEGVEDNMNVSMLMEQALGELEVSLGLPPSMQYKHPRPEWMPNFVWDPPL